MQTGNKEYGSLSAFLDTLVEGNVNIILSVRRNILKQVVSLQRYGFVKLMHLASQLLRATAMGKSNKPAEAHNTMYHIEYVEDTL